jgi:hypothetical protein
MGTSRLMILVSPIPKFAQPCGTSYANFGIKGTQQIYDSSAPFEPEVSLSDSRHICANFGFETLVPLFNLKFLDEIAAGGAGTSNPRH